MKRLARRHRLAAALLVLAALVLAACGGGDETSTTGGAPATTPGSVGSTDDGAPEAGGTLTFLEYQAPTCLYAGGSGFYPNATIINQVGDKLTYQDPATREITPWLATSWEINEDSTEYVFHLRDDVTFSNGTPLDAAAVALNFDHFGLGDEELGLAPQEFISNYVSSEVIDDHTVKFTFDAPTPGFLQATSVVGAAIVAPETASLPYEEQCQPENYIASGPFVISSVVPEREYVLTARDDYAWGPEAIGHTGRAFLDEIKIVVTPEDSVRIGAVTAGEADMFRTIQAYDEPAFLAQGFQVFAAPTNGVNPSLALRFQNPALSELAVRRALLRGTNVDLVVDTLYSDLYPRATSVLSQSATGYVDLSDELYYDQEEAIRLLDEAGWVPGSDGIREKGGVRLELTTFVTSVFPQSQQHLELIAQQWEELGVKLHIELPDPATQTQRQRDFNDIGVQGAHVGRVDPDVLTSAFHSQLPRNNLLSNDTELDALLDAISVGLTTEERFEAAEAVQRYLIDQAYVIPLFELPQTYGAAPYVKGVRWEAVGRIHLYTTWLDR